MKSKINILTDNNSIKSYVMDGRTRDKIIKSKKTFVTFCEANTKQMITINKNMITSIEVYREPCRMPISKTNLAVNNIETSILDINRRLNSMEQRFTNQDSINREISIRQDERSKIYNEINRRR